MCRVRSVHTTPPWTTAYICITVDESCTDENGKYVDKPLTVRMVQWQPYCVVKPFDSKTPVCASCKRTNRTRSFCRERHRHRHLPWCTVYVLLSALDQTDPTTVVAGASTKVDLDEDQENSSAGDECKPKAYEDLSTAGSDTIASDADGESDDINDIPESRTFLAKVSSRGTAIHWLELADYDPQADPSFVATVQEAQHFEPTAAPEHAAPYYHSMGYAAQAHQNALKSHQQYFFQMQRQQQQHHHQQQQHQYAPAPSQWQYNMGQGDPTQVGATATGDTTGSKRSVQDESYQALQQQQWMLYYGQGYGQEATAPGALVHEIHNPDRDLHAEANGDSDDADSKRQRVL